MFWWWMWSQTGRYSHWSRDCCSKTEELEVWQGDDILSPRLLRNISSKIASPAAIIFRKSLDTGCIPRDWSKCNSTVQKWNRSQGENYRPVSLTSQICKVVESILIDELVQHLESNKLLHNSQHGFCSGHSCATNLLTFLETVTAFVNDKVSKHRYCLPRPG